MVFFRTTYKKIPRMLIYLRGFIIALLVIALIGWLIEWLRTL